MPDEKSVLKYETILPADFDGTFRFSNPSKEDFIGIWGGKQHLFPAESTVPIIMSDHSPLEIQNIRKKFAKDLAEREFYKSKSYKNLQGQEGKPGARTMNSIHQAAAYTLSDLEPYIQQCLKPLPMATLTVKPVNRQPLENHLSRNDDGDLNTEAIDRKTSLVEKALKS